MATIAPMIQGAASPTNRLATSATRTPGTALAIIPSSMVRSRTGAIRIKQQEAHGDPHDTNADPDKPHANDLFQMPSKDRESLAEGCGYPQVIQDARPFDRLHHQRQEYAARKQQVTCQSEQAKRSDRAENNSQNIACSDEQQGGKRQQENQDKCQRSQQGYRQIE